jgi:hypothetical protein
LNKEELKELMDRKAAVYLRVFGSAEGREILADLQRSNPAGNLFEENTNKQYHRLGRFEVVQGIVDLVERGRRNATGSYE